MKPSCNPNCLFNINNVQKLSHSVTTDIHSLGLELIGAQPRMQTRVQSYQRYITMGITQTKGNCKRQFYCRKGIGSRLYLFDLILPGIYSGIGRIFLPWPNLKVAFSTLLKKLEKSALTLRRIKFYFNSKQHLL